MYIQEANIYILLVSVYYYLPGKAESSKPAAVCRICLRSQAPCMLFADIIVPPQPVNTSINEVAELNCTAIANAIIWKANGITLQDTNQIQIFETINASQGIYMSTLTISVSSVDDATNITCIATTVKNSMITAVNESKPVELLVQGI